MLLSDQNSNPKFDMIQVEGTLTVSIDRTIACFYKTEIPITPRLPLERALRLLLEKNSVERTVFRPTRGEALRLLRINSSRTFIKKTSMKEIIQIIF